MTLKDELKTIQNSIVSADVKKLVEALKVFAANNPNEKKMVVSEFEYSDDIINAIKYLGLTVDYYSDQRDGGIYQIRWDD